jgi:hypothetical protein
MLGDSQRKTHGGDERQPGVSAEGTHLPVSPPAEGGSSPDGMGRRTARRGATGSHGSEVGATSNVGWSVASECG